MSTFIFSQKVGIFKQAPFIVKHFGHFKILRPPIKIKKLSKNIEKSRSVCYNEREAKFITSQIHF